MEAERDELPELHFAARVQSAVAHIAVESARMRELGPQVREAEEKIEPLLQAAREAQAKADLAQAELSQLRGARGMAEERRRMHEQALEKVEAEGPRQIYS